MAKKDPDFLKQLLKYEQEFYVINCEIKFFIQVVLDLYNKYNNSHITIDEMRSKKRDRKLVYLRMILSYLIRKKYKKETVENIGRYLNRHFSSIVFYQKAHHDNVKYDRNYSKIFTYIEEYVKKICI